MRLERAVARHCGPGPADYVLLLTFGGDLLGLAVPAQAGRPATIYSPEAIGEGVGLADRLGRLAEDLAADITLDTAHDGKVYYTLGGV